MDETAPRRFRADPNRDAPFFRPQEWAAIEDGTHMLHKPTGAVFILDLEVFAEGIFATLGAGPTKPVEVARLDQLGRMAVMAFSENTKLFVADCNRRLRNTLNRIREEKIVEKAKGLRP